MTSQQAEFGKIRSLLWPVHNFELKKLLPMFFMFFCISFNYTVLRNTKDVLILSAPGASSHTLTFLKLWAVLPASIAFMVLFSKLSNVLNKEKLFYTLLFPFVLFFGLFGFVLYPMQDVLHPSTSADYLATLLPDGLAYKSAVAVYRNWTSAMFYVMAELWGSVMLSLLFWGFANEITKTNEAKRFYGLLGIGANVALYFAGTACKWVASAGAERSYQDSLQTLTTLVLVGGVSIFLVYYWMNRVVLTDPRFYTPNETKKGKKKKPKLGLGESFKLLRDSAYLRCIAMLVIAYGISINLIEIIWKGQVKQLYTTPNEMQFFFGNINQYTAISTIFMLFFVSHNLIRRVGWKAGALFTPIMLASTGALFLAFVVFNEQFASWVVFMGTSPMMLAVMFGGMQNILSKSSKYSLFDPTKEMAYIPLDQDSKVKGKAAIDVVGARLGKSGGSATIWLLGFALPNIAAMTPYIGVIFLMICGLWLWSVSSLSKQYQQLLKKPGSQSASEKTQEHREPSAKKQSSDDQTAPALS